MNTIGDNVATALDLQEDSRGVGEAVPVSQHRHTTRSHHPVHLSLRHKKVMNTTQLGTRDTFRDNGTKDIFLK